MEQSATFYMRYSVIEDKIYNILYNLLKLHMLKVVPNKSQQGPDIQTEKSIVQFLNNIVKPFRGLSGQFWANFLLFCLLFTLMGSNGISFLAFYMVDIFQIVRKNISRNILSLFLSSQAGSPLPASHTSWITSITKIVCAFASFYVLHRFERYL